MLPKVSSKCVSSNRNSSSSPPLVLLIVQLLCLLSRNLFLFKLIMGLILHLYERGPKNVSLKHLDCILNYSWEDCDLNHLNRCKLKKCLIFYAVIKQFLFCPNFFAAVYCRFESWALRCSRSSIQRTGKFLQKGSRKSENKWRLLSSSKTWTTLSSEIFCEFKIK